MDIEDKEHFLAVVKDAYLLAERGQLNLGHVIIRRTEEGYQLEQNETEEIKPRMGKQKGFLANATDESGSQEMANFHIDEKLSIELKLAVQQFYKEVTGKNPKTKREYLDSFSSIFRGFGFSDGRTVFGLANVSASRADAFTPKELTGEFNAMQSSAQKAPQKF